MMLETRFLSLGIEYHKVRVVPLLSFAGLHGVYNALALGVKKTNKTRLVEMMIAG